MINPADYTKLVWKDEFVKPFLDSEKWEMEVGEKWFNHELQAYTNSKQNVYIKNSQLIIQAKKQKYKSAQYTSARIRTKNKGDWRSGKIEVRAKLPKGQGIWPAIWMLPTHAKYGKWPKSGEIDIVELRGQHPDKIISALHYGQNYPNNKYLTGEYQLKNGSFSDDFHVFSLLWDTDQLHWFVDGQKYFSIYAADLKPDSFIFNAKFHLLLNVAVGGDFLGNPDNSTIFPQQMVVDFVKVYQLNNINKRK